MGILRIVSYRSEAFLDRREAGRELAAELLGYSGKRTVVLGIPRGGVVVADEIARRLGSDLDIILAHKLRTPGQSELAMGAVSEDGGLIINQGVVDGAGIAPRFIRDEKERQMTEIRRRIALFRRKRPKIDLQGRTVIITDDGVATGATTLAAIQAIKLERPDRIIAAFPVGLEDTIRMLAGYVDEMVCLRAPPDFDAVGQFYIDFVQVDDEGVIDLLNGKKSGR